jgi:hypothetical protein
VAPSIYEGKRVFIATKHQKERVVKIPFLTKLGATVVCYSGLDTDTLGTFSGRVVRTLSPKDAAVTKARAAADANPDGLGIGSEGSVGSDPLVPFAITNEELIAFVDKNIGLTCIARHTDYRPVYRSVEVRAAVDINNVLANFPLKPYAALVTAVPRASMWPLGVLSKRNGEIIEVAKDIQSLPDLLGVVNRASHETSYEQIHVTTDFRAHLNPRRMLTIGRAARRLTTKLECSCPRCSAPGFDVRKGLPGLPCESCGTPSQYAAAELWGCSVCGLEEERPRGDGLTVVESQYCGYCNP